MKKQAPSNRTPVDSPALSDPSATRSAGNKASAATRPMRKPWWVKVLLALALLALAYVAVKYVAPLLAPSWHRLNIGVGPENYGYREQLSGPLLSGLVVGFLFTVVPILLLIPVFSNRVRWILTAIFMVLAVASILPWALNLTRATHGSLDAFVLTSLITGSLTLIFMILLLIFVIAYIRRGVQIKKLRAALANDLPAPNESSRSARHTLGQPHTSTTAILAGSGPGSNPSGVGAGSGAASGAAAAAISGDGESVGAGRDVSGRTSRRRALREERREATAPASDASEPDYSDWMSKIDEHDPEK